MIAERHGAQRASFGWSDEHYRRELAILREVIEATIRQRHSIAADANVVAAIGILRQLLEHVERAGARGLELAQAHPGVGA